MCMDLIHTAIGYAPTGFEVLEYVASITVFVYCIRAIIGLFGTVIQHTKK